MANVGKHNIHGSYGYQCTQKKCEHLFNSFFAIFAHVIILLEEPAPWHSTKSNKKKVISSKWHRLFQEWFWGPGVPKFVSSHPSLANLFCKSLDVTWVLKFHLTSPPSRVSSSSSPPSPSSCLYEADWLFRSGWWIAGGFHWAYK